MSCFFLPDVYVAKWHVMFVCCLFLPDVSVAILAFVLYVSPDACVATWLVWFVIFADAFKAILALFVCFRLMPHGYMACFVSYLFLPDASKAIRHVLFVFA